MECIQRRLSMKLVYSPRETCLGSYQMHSTHVTLGRRMRTGCPACDQSLVELEKAYGACVGNRLHLAEIVRCQLGRRYDGSKARNTKHLSFGITRVHSTGHYSIKLRGNNGSLLQQHLTCSGYRIAANYFNA